MQNPVLRFAASLAAVPTGEEGAVLLEFSSTPDPVSAREMSQAIEEGCERIDAAEW
ncbi:MAG: hypothetical protein ABSH32_26925 [Bryobacteraceae bacterium]|jgi:hypothetical protein